MIITIDGPAGSGKSAAALLLAERLKISHLDTGAMYRAVALDGLETGVLADPAALAARAAQICLSFDWTRSPAAILLNGRDVSSEIRQPNITEITYLPADNPGVREVLVRLQRQIGRERGSLVTEGRDQGTVVFPDADFKFYIDAKPEERARRRIAQLAEKGIQADAQEILAQILQRDARDRSRAVGPLALPKDGIVLDTTPLTLMQVVDLMHRIVTTGARP